MGLTRKHIFTEEQNALASMAKILAHPARIAIIQHLMKQQDCICGELVEVIGLAQPTISQHLKELKKGGIIQGTVEGTRMCYCIDPEKWEELRNSLNLFLDSSPPSSKKCC